MTEAHGSTATPEHESSDDLGVDETPPGGKDRKGRRAAAEKPEPKKKSVFARLAVFYRQIIAELRKVVWPTRNELVTYTTVVIVFCLIIIGIVYTLDLGFARAALEVFG
ncbi:preprotein translocase subunit SecE [Yinghuangia seranimata]|uniref:preprotein translocase subunit SecE n=1 Tax=Yinghuangia seranimata TaxID=408067 RepID=UPI00248C0439|nr:preprotein translocase subunit SecE [Yinghuangia seranimata]MDI2126906.1 preprotein translocase subunit SecE [Yinghuangia seranimata]